MITRVVPQRCACGKPMPTSTETKRHECKCGEWHALPWGNLFAWFGTRHGKACDRCESLESENRALRAEVERLRAIRDAAERWRANPNSAGAENRLLDALDAYQEGNDD